MNIELLDQIAEHLEGDIDGAPDAGPSAKKAAYLLRDLEEIRGARFLIWQPKRQMYWGPNKCGYTPDKTKAGHYHLEEAIELSRASNQQPDYVGSVIIPT